MIISTVSEIFYKTFTVESGDTAIDLQGIKFSTNSGGRLPVHSYVKATLEYRDRLKQNQTTIEQIAKVNGLSPKYLRRLWKLFIDEPSVGDSSENASFVIAEIRAAWKLATPDEAEQISKQIIFWQEKLWKFNVVGQIGRSNWPQGMAGANQSDPNGPRISDSSRRCFQVGRFTRAGE